MYYEDSLEPGLDEHQASVGARPANVPEKFWDPATGSIRTDALLRAYLDCERRLHRMVKLPDRSNPEEMAAFRRALGIPDSHEDYVIEQRHELLSPDPDVNRRLHEACFTPEQVQLVYDLAFERVIPMIEDMKAEYEHRSGLDQLKSHFGGDARWTTSARQIAAWGKANLPAEVYEALSGSAQGVIAMQKMMDAGEPMLGRAPVPADEPPNEAELKKMMQDPRYWKKRDPAFIEKVSAGFRRIYGE